MDNNQNDVKVSIVMPVFNTAPYLRQCLDSVLVQTLKEFELICVDDGSTDGSTEILEEYAKKDSRIIVRHQENMGPAIARNNALSIARGKYVAFMDGDDFYPENSTLEKLFNAAEQTGCKIAGGYRSILRNDNSIKEEKKDIVYIYIKNNLPDGGVVKYSELQTDFNYQCYIYSREFLESNGITFPDYRRFQDPPFFVNAMIAADNIYLIPTPTYVYRWGRRNIVWDLRKKEDLLLGHIDVLKLAHDYNLDILYINTLSKLVQDYTKIIFNDFSLEFFSIYIFTLVTITIDPPAMLVDDTKINRLKQRLLNAIENEVIKSMKGLTVDDIILFTDKTFEECLKKNSEEIYCAAVTSLFRIAGNLKSTTATAMRLKITESYINSPYYKPNDDNGTITADDSQLKAAIIWYEQYKKIEKHNAELISKEAAESNTVQNDVKVSIVMPVYNTAPYLRQCLDSVLAQTLKEFELICVDDDSTDGSVEILEEYAKKDERIQILKQQNQYAGVARNNGLKIAKGEYVIFLDSDDVFSDVLLEHTYNAGIEKKADIVLLDIMRFDHDTKKPQWTILAHNIFPDKDVFSWCDIPEDIFSIAPPGTFSSLYRREFINEHNLQFQALPNSNDLYFTLYARALAERITIVDETLVYYRANRPDSLQSYKKNENSLCFLQAFYALYNDLYKDNLYEPLKLAFQFRLFDTLNYNFNTVKTVKARLAILQVLDEKPYCNFPIDDDPGNYEKNKTVTQYFNKFKAARNWYHKNLRINQLGEELKNTKTTPPIEEQGTITVSVIIPVYNTEAYLREAMDSIVNQTLRDIEIICVNDGSTDGSAGILEDYAKKDSRISIITQENKGLSCSRNAGIMVAKGKYIYFMDSDDVLETTALEELVSLMEAKELEALYFDGESFTEDPELMTKYYKTAYRRSKAYNEVYKGAELFKLFRQENCYTQSACLQILKTSFLRENDIYFIPGILHEDNAFTYSALLNAKRASHTNKIYFHRRLRGSSIMTDTVSFENIYGKYTCLMDMFKTYYACLPKLSEDAAFYAMQNIGALLSNIQNQYEKLPDEEIGSELGMTEDVFIFDQLIKNRPKTNSKNKITNNSLREKLEKSWQRNTRLKDKLLSTRQRKNELKEKLNKQKAKDKKLNEKLESSKMKNEKLQAKLDAYKQENQTLKKKLKNEKKKYNKVRNSTSYKIGRIITYIPRKIRKLFKK